MSDNFRIAVVGAGASGLTAARILHGTHQITVYESAAHVGGHAHTIEVPNHQGQLTQVDAGVCMFYTTAYPNLFQLLNSLRVPTERCEMTVELSAIRSGKRYHFDLNAPWQTLFHSLLTADQRWLIHDGLRFYRHASAASLPGTESQQTLGEHLATEQYSEPFRIFLAFLCGSTWTLNQRGVNNIPFTFVTKMMRELGFFPALRHGEWRHIPGSVGRYLDALAAPLAGRIRLASEVEKVERTPSGVTVYCGGLGEDYDHVVFALPANVAIGLIANPSDTEREVLGAFTSQQNTVYFTSDEDLVRSWTSSDRALFAASDVADETEEVGREFLFRAGFADLTRTCGYSLERPLYMWYQFPDAPVPKQVYLRSDFSTPHFTHQSIQAQARHAEVSGANRLHFCGTGWVNGIHEGAILSALRVTRWFGRGLDHLTGEG